jgi:hypothetical protein
MTTRLRVAPLPDKSGYSVEVCDRSWIAPNDSLIEISGWRIVGGTIEVEGLVRITPWAERRLARQARITWRWDYFWRWSPVRNFTWPPLPHAVWSRWISHGHYGRSWHHVVDPRNLRVDIDIRHIAILN